MCISMIEEPMGVHNCAGDKEVQDSLPTRMIRVLILSQRRSCCAASICMSQGAVCTPRSRQFFRASILELFETEERSALAKGQYIALIFRSTREDLGLSAMLSLLQQVKEVLKEGYGDIYLDFVLVRKPESAHVPYFSTPVLRDLCFNAS